MMSVEVDPLGNHQEFIEELAGLLMIEWHEPQTTAQLQSRIEKLRTHTNAGAFPAAWVAHRDNVPLGIVALRGQELDEYPELSPWLGGLFVRPECRGQGLGSFLCRVAEENALLLGIREMFLFTLDRHSMYQRLGWRSHLDASWFGRPGQIMTKSL
jgi:GNAT superfamily N-acetyltransferase